MVQQSSRPLELNVQQVGDAWVMTVRGSVGMVESERIKAELDELAFRKPAVIVLEISGLDFICSQGLGALISAHVRGRHYNGQIRLVNPQAAVRQLLEMTRLVKLFPIYVSVEEALA